MKRVTGIGGIFFKSKDPEKIREWYDKHLGIKSTKYGGAFEWKKENGESGYTAWSPFKENTTYFGSEEQKLMFNYRVDNLVELLKVLEKEGVTVVGKIEEAEYGKFGWILDPEGNKIELWEPVDKMYGTMGEANKSS